MKQHVLINLHHTERIRVFLSRERERGDGTSIRPAGSEPMRWIKRQQAANKERAWILGIHTEEARDRKIRRK